MIEDNFDCECSKTDDSCGLIAENGSNAVQKVVVCDNRTMCILDELNQIFAERLADIEQQTNGSFELKYLTYKEWVEMLIKLMKDLIDVVQELEYEASSRIELLERKLQIETAPCSMGDIPKLRNDVSNLLELIRRAIDDKSWNLDDLEFCTFKATDFFRELSENSSARTSREIQDISHKGTNDIKCLNSQLIARNHEIKRLESERHTLNTELKSKDLLIENYISRINKLEKSLKPQKDRKLSFSCEQQEETLTGNEEDEVFKNCIAELKDCLRQKEHQLAEKLKHNECLQTELRLFKTQAAQKDKAVTNMRALAFEVAEKHDQILQMRCQVTSLEEELKKAHKKIQFKDNVIRDLRRDCKISAKNVLSEIRPLIPIRSEGAKSDSDADRQSFKSVGFTDLEITERSDHTMNTVIAAEFLKLGSSVHEEEQQYLKVLKKELDDLLRFQDSRNEAVEDERKSMSSQHMKLREAVDRMFCDLMKNRTKLYYIRNELKSISGSSDTSQAHTGDVDSGYISPEDMEPELHIINSVRSCMNELREENDCLKMKMRKLNADELSGASSGFDKPVPDLYNKKLLQEVASVLSNICGKAIPVQSGPSFESCEGQVHPICQAMMNLEAELLEKDVVLRNSKEVMSKKEAELKSLKLHCYNLEEECDNKNHTISQLQQAVDLHVHSIERLQQAKDNLETEMNSLKGMTDSSKYTALLESKNKLEVECHNQVTTINNLRQALESFKKNGSLQTSGSPVICTDIQHDILAEQLAEMFLELMHLEGKLKQLRDENLCLKELLVDTECDFQSLERKYLKISMKLNGSNEIENEFKQLNDRSLQLHREIEILGGEQLYVNCFRHIRAKMEKECRKRLNDQEQKYREIIDDLTNELSRLSDQVQIAQDESNHDEITASFDASFHALEAQNDLLQNTIGRLEKKICGYDSCLKENEVEIRKLQTKNAASQDVIDKKDAKFEELCDQYQALAKSIQEMKVRCKCGASQMVQNTSLIHMGRAVFNVASEKSRELMSYKSEERSRLSVGTYDPEEKLKQMEVKMSLLEKTLEKREQDLRETTARLLEFAQRDGELTCELLMNQDQVSYLRTEEDRMKNTIDRLSRELCELKTVKREREGNLVGELAGLHHAMKEHSKALSKANETINNLHGQMRAYRRQIPLTRRYENAVLKAEVFKLKENKASQDGIEQSLRSQLMKTQNEVSMMRCDLERYTSLTEDIENLKKHCSRLKESNYDLVRKYNDLVEDYNHLEEEYRKIIEIKDQLFSEVEATRKWKHSQIEQDQLILSKIQKLEEHINTLLDDRKKLIAKINELHRDTVIISGELEHFKDICSYSLSSDTHERKSQSLVMENRDDKVDNIIRKIRRTARKLSQTRYIWQEGLRRFSD